MSDKMTCPRCDGHGLIWCDTCSGRGVEYVYDEDDEREYPVTCGVCGGEKSRTCPRCGGTGEVRNPY